MASSLGSLDRNLRSWDVARRHGGVLRSVLALSFVLSSHSHSQLTRSPDHRSPITDHVLLSCEQDKNKAASEPSFSLSSTMKSSTNFWYARRPHTSRMSICVARARARLFFLTPLTGLRVLRCAVNTVQVRYYRRLGFKDVRDVGDTLASLGDRLVRPAPHSSHPDPHAR